MESVANVQDTSVSSPDISVKIDSKIEQKLEGVEAAAPSVAEVAPSEPPKDLSASWAAMAKKERYIQQQMKDLKEAQAELKRYKELKAKAKEAPHEFLQEGGLSLDDILQHELKKTVKPSTEDEVLSLKEKIKAWEDREAKKQQEQKEQERQKTISDFKSQIKAHAESAPEEYELLAAFDAYDSVFDVIEQFYARKGEILDTKKACDYVESTLLERVTKYKDLKKVRGLFETKQPEAALEKATETPDIQKPKTLTSVTLTSKDTITPALDLKDAQGGLLSEEESKRKAAAWLQARIEARKSGKI